MKYISPLLLSLAITFTPYLSGEPSKEKSTVFRVMEDRYSVYLVSPEQVDSTSLFKSSEEYIFLTKSRNELTVIARSGTIGSCTKEDRDWVGLEIVDDVPFDVSGLLHEILGPFADQKIAVLVESNYRTDVIFIKKQNLEKALKALREAGYKILE